MESINNFILLCAVLAGLSAGMLIGYAVSVSFIKRLKHELSWVKKMNNVNAAECVRLNKLVRKLSDEQSKLGVIRNQKGQFEAVKTEKL